MLRAEAFPHLLRLVRPSRTSRETLHTKKVWYVRLTDVGHPDVHGVGEAAMFPGLSADDTPDYEQMLKHCCNQINSLDIHSIPSSAIRMAFETALSDLRNGGTMRPFHTSDNWKVQINGLVWMNDMDTMMAEARRKVQLGFRCVKLKIGGIDFEDELRIVEAIRRSCPSLEIRLDANGAFTPDNAMEKLNRLAVYGIHSIEQPIRAGQLREMARICGDSPIPVALDEELIGITPSSGKRRLLAAVKPAYIILKPSLCGGFRQADEWIEAARENGVMYWATSALESNVGLNAIARWVAAKSPELPQGLGTGLMYVNNVASPLELTGEILSTNSSLSWDLPF